MCHKEIASSFFLNDLGWVRVVIRKFTDYPWGKHSSASSVNCSSNFYQVTIIKKELIPGLLNRKIFPENLVDLKNAFNAVTISSSECERGFSQMNLILTSTRASLLTTTVSALLFVRVDGPPIRHFSPTKYVESWILRGRHSAIDTNSKDR
jgi:hypothetical protein